MSGHHYKPYAALSDPERAVVDRVRQQMLEAWPLVQEAIAADEANDLAELRRLEPLLQPLTNAIGDIIPIVWATVDPATIAAAWRIVLFAQYLVAAQVEMMSRFTTPAARPLAA